MKKQILSLLVLSSLAISASAQTTALELCSPKNDDHFAVTKPLLFWQASPGAKSYEVYVDDKKVGDAPASAGPVVHYGLTTALAEGSHHWYIKAVPATGQAVSSSPSAFTVDPPENWPAWAIGPFVRYGKNPILSPKGTEWESVNAFNPGAVYADGKFRMLYRAQGHHGWPSVEGYAESTDGVTFVSKPNPVIDKTEPFEKNYGCEDARLFKLGDTYYAFYTGNATRGLAICEATSPDAVTWKKLGPVVPGTKNAAIVCDPNGTPLKINGKYVMYCGNSNFKISYSDDMLTWTPTVNLPIKLTAGWVGPYEPCVAVMDPSSAHPDNIVLFIAGTLNGKGKWFYAISEMLINKADLTQKVEQLDDCIMKPREPYESGQNKNCLWTNCILQHDGQWYLYYGAGDRYVALANAPVK